MSFQLADHDGYSKQREEIDALILNLLKEGGKTATEVQTVLRAAGVGDATSDAQPMLSYSSTGAIARAALGSLRGRNLIHDSWDIRARPYEKPFRYFAGGRSTRLAVRGL